MCHLRLKLCSVFFLQGVFLGPLIMTVLYAAKNLYTEFVLDVHAEYTA